MLDRPNISLNLPKNIIVNKSYDKLSFKHNSIKNTGKAAKNNSVSI